MKLLNKTDDPTQLSLKGKLSFLAKDAFFFGGLKGISLLFPFIMIPILTNYFNLEEYGIYDSLLVLSGFLALFIVFGQDSAVARWFYQVENEQEKKHVISESLFIQIVSTLFFLVPAIIYAEKITKFYFNTAEYTDHFRIIVYLGFFLVINNFSVNILKWSFKRKQYALLVLLKPILQLTTLIIVIHHKLSLIDFLTYSLLSQIIVSLFGFIFCFNYLVVPTKLHFTKKLLKYGIPLGLIAATSSIMPAIDRKIIIDWVNDSSSLGIYALALKIALLIKVGDSIFHMAWGPFSLAIFKEQDAQKVYSLVLNVYFIFFLFFIVVLWFFSPLLINVLGGEIYESAFVLVLPLLFSSFFNGLSGITGVGIGLSMKSHLNLYPFVISIFILIISSYFLVPIYGLFGVAISLMLSNIIKFIILSYLSRISYRLIQLQFLPYFIKGLVFFVILKVLEIIDINIMFKVIIMSIIIFMTVYFTIDKLIKERLKRVLIKYN